MMGIEFQQPTKTRNNIINDSTIFKFDKDYNLTEKIFSHTADIKNNMDL